MWRAVGADTWNPFKQYEAKASAMGINSVQSSSVSITVPAGVKRGLLICISTGWMSRVYQDTPSGSGLNKIVSTKYKEAAVGTCSNLVSIYECRFIPGGTIIFPYNAIGASSGYPTAQLILIA